MDEHDGVSTWLAVQHMSRRSPTPQAGWCGRTIGSAGHSRGAAVWAKVPAGARLQLVIDPTRNASVPLTAWFRARAPQ